MVVDSYDLYLFRQEEERERMMEEGKCLDCIYLEFSPTHDDVAYCTKKDLWVEGTEIEGNYGCPDHVTFPTDDYQFGG